MQRSDPIYWVKSQHIHGPFTDHWLTTKKLLNRPPTEHSLATNHPLTSNSLPTHWPPTGYPIHWPPLIIHWSSSEHPTYRPPTDYLLTCHTVHSLTTELLPTDYNFETTARRKSHKRLVCLKRIHREIINDKKWKNSCYDYNVKVGFIDIYPIVTSLTGVLTPT